MAEIGLVASVVQIADTGIKLSITLYTFAETVLTADKSIREIASDVSLTSSVLEELGRNLKKDQKSRLCSDNAVRTAEGIVKECAVIFDEINGTLETTLEKIKPRAGTGKQNGKDGAHGGRKLAVAALERLKWPFLQPRMQLLRSNLDRLKSTLVLMLNVITYARKVSEDHATPSTLEDQRKLIEDLARSNQEYTRKFKELTKAVEAGQDDLETVKPPPTVQKTTPTGFFQTNMVLPPSQAFHFTSERSPDITSRLTTLAKQHLPPDAGEQSDELAHYCLLINHLLQRIDAVQYKIKSDLRRRIRNDVVHMHQREADQLRDVHGHGNFTTVMGSTISWAEILQPTESGTSQTLRNLFSAYGQPQQQTFEGVHGNAQGRAEMHEGNLPPPSSAGTNHSDLDHREERVRLDERVERMIALERLMRPFTAGEETAPVRTAGASYHTRRDPASRTDSLLESNEDEPEVFDDISHDEQVAASAVENLKAHREAKLRDEDSRLRDEATRLLGEFIPPKSAYRRHAVLGNSLDEIAVSPLKSNKFDHPTTMPHSVAGLSRKLSRNGFFSRSNADSNLQAPEQLGHKGTEVIEHSRQDTHLSLIPESLDQGRNDIKVGSSRRTNASLASNPLDDDRARIKKALDAERDELEMDDELDNQSNRLIFSTGQGSHDLLLKEMQVLDALALIRDRMLAIVAPDYLPIQQPQTVHPSDIAKDAISTAKKFWHCVGLIYDQAHGQKPHADRVLAVARLAKLVLQSLPGRVREWPGPAKTEKLINSLIDGSEMRDEALMMREAIRTASTEFAFLSSSQRRLLREAWPSGVEADKMPDAAVTHARKSRGRLQRLSQSITSFSLPGRRKAPRIVAECASIKPELPWSEEYPAEVRSQEIHELPATLERKGREEDAVQVPKFYGVVPHRDVIASVHTGEQDEQQNVLFSALRRMTAESNQPKLESVRTQRSSKASSQAYSESGSLMVMDRGPRGEPFCIEDLSNLGSWADESAAAPPQPSDKAEDTNPENDVYARHMWGSDDDFISASHVEDAEDYSPVGVMARSTRPRTPDVVDDLLAEWTTLPR